MSEITPKAAVCEMCLGKLIFRNSEMFECESCGTNYPKDWVKAKIQEITGTVKIDGTVKVQFDGDVVGGESADAMYTRALDWLNLQNQQKAIATLKDLVEKYPGDKRGWQKLALIFPIPMNKEYLDVALKFDDEEFREIIEKDKVKREEEARMLCDHIRNSNGMEWIEKLFTKNQTGSLTSSINHKYRNLSCVDELIAEGKLCAAIFNNSLSKIENILYKNKRDYVERMTMLRGFTFALQELLNIHNPVYCLPTYELRAEFIFNNLIYLSGTNDGEYVGYWKESDIYLSQNAIQDSFSEIERRLKSSLCLKCGTRKSLLSGKCPKCKV